MIRWITERLGTGPFHELGSGTWSVLDVRYFVDKGGNSSADVLKVLQQGVDALRRGERVVVACDLGISRSNAISAGILSLFENRSYDWAVREVIRTTGEHDIKLDLVETVRHALGQHTQARQRNAILVTGGAGFVGRALVSRLRSVHAVRAPTRASLNLENGAAVLADYCACNDVGQIVHLAHPGRHTNVRAIASSLTMLRTVVDVCRLQSIRLVHVSCSSVFSGFSSPALFVDETTPLRPKGIDGETKYLEEMLVDLYFRRGEIDRALCRIAPVYGPGGERPRFIRTFCDAAQKGQIVRTHRFRNGRPALDLLHVSDAADALARVIATSTSDIFHVGTGELHMTADIAGSIGQMIGQPIIHEEIDIEDDVGNIAFPSKKARLTLGWEPRIGLDEGLRGMLAPSGGCPD